MEFILTVILVFFIISFLGKLFFRYVLPWWLARFVKKQQKKYERQFYNEEKINGEEKIRYKNSDIEGSVNPDVGEYVDFEEIDDEQDNTEERKE